MKAIEKLVYTNSAGESIEFSVYSMYHVNISKDVEGLSDIENEVYSTTGINQAGETYLGYHIESKDIELEGHFRTVDKLEILKLRRNLNHVLNPLLEGTLTYTCGDSSRQIRCRIHEAPTFEADDVFTQFNIELLALSPYWEDTEETYTYVATWLGSMEFDSKNGLQLTNSEADPQWIIGYKQPALITNIENVGDTDTGITVTFTALGNVSNPCIIDIRTQEFLKINIDLLPTEQVIITTGYGNKTCTLINADGEKTDAFRNLDIGSTYLQLNIGDNPYRFKADIGEDICNVVITHSNKYLGA